MGVQVDANRPPVVCALRAVAGAEFTGLSQFQARQGFRLPAAGGGRGEQIGTGVAMACMSCLLPQQLPISVCHG
eukprot:CAMPEP_0168383800 /NCGR_PEP_ID=MMETSP0228-20121227/14086_1 /TAXON_ID=133427 /ORGANISM="Protoceratium reticulatum, Strain CCCM 535 (=CCMP 1889)" /LENGTH=73 /DNA_ID=CAMNT_0008396955 /DNA_START=47 /DNA_END=265 /DNA_ORIENTATION=-